VLDIAGVSRGGLEERRGALDAHRDFFSPGLHVGFKV
jgi:hypothetical protein